MSAAMSRYDRKIMLVSSDHNGNAARAYVLKHCGGDDVGASYDEKVDYVDMAEALCQGIRNRLDYAVGVLICGTGTGMSIAANRFPWVRAALCTDVASARLCREHNDANVLVLGSWRTPLDDMPRIVEAFLETEHAGGRHTSRLEKLSRMKVDP